MEILGRKHIVHEEHYPECEHQDLVTRIMRAQRRSVAVQIGHRLTSFSLCAIPQRVSIIPLLLLGVPLGLTMPYTLRAWQSNWNQLGPARLLSHFHALEYGRDGRDSAPKTRGSVSTSTHLPSYIDKNISRSRGEWESGVCRIGGLLLGSVRRLLSQTRHRPVTNYLGFFVSIANQASF